MNWGKYQILCLSKELISSIRKTPKSMKTKTQHNKKTKGRDQNIHSENRLWLEMLLVVTGRTRGGRGKLHSSPHFFLECLSRAALAYGGGPWSPTAGFQPVSKSHSLIFASSFKSCKFKEKVFSPPMRLAMRKSCKVHS